MEPQTTRIDVSPNSHGLCKGSIAILEHPFVSGGCGFAGDFILLVWVSGLFVLWVYPAPHIELGSSFSEGYRGDLLVHGTILVSHRAQAAEGDRMSAPQPVLRNGWSASTLLSGIHAMDADGMKAIKQELPDDPVELQRMHEVVYAHIKCMISACMHVHVKPMGHETDLTAGASFYVSSCGG